MAGITLQNVSFGDVRRIGDDERKGHRRAQHRARRARSPAIGGFLHQGWALDEVAVAGDGIHLRATGGAHHVLTIRERPKPTLLGVNFAAPDRTTVDQLCAKAKAYGVKVLGDPAPLSGAGGVGYGFRFETPDGLPMSISSDGTQHLDVVLDRSRPTKISHVVLNSADADEQMPFL